MGVVSRIDVINMALIGIGEESIISLTDTGKAARNARALYDQKRQALIREHPWHFAMKEMKLTTPLPGGAPFPPSGSGGITTYQNPSPPGWPPNPPMGGWPPGGAPPAFAPTGWVNGDGWPWAPAIAQNPPPGGYPPQTNPVFGYKWAFQLPADYIKFYRPEYLVTRFAIQGRTILSNETSVNLVYIADVENEGEWDQLFTEAFAARLGMEICLSVVADPAKVNSATQIYQAKLSAARFANAIETPGQQLEAGDWVDARLAIGQNLSTGSTF